MRRESTGKPPDYPSKLARTFSSRGGRIYPLIARIDRAHSDRAHFRHTVVPSKPTRFLLSGDCLVGVLLRASNEGLPRPRVARAQDTGQAVPSYVSIISNRASNSCPQAVQRMQSDSTVNSSDLIPIPPQSGQRARWTL